MRIESYVGVDDVRFGISPSAVTSALGPCEEVDINYLGEMIEYRRGRNLVTTYSGDRRLVELGLNPEVGELTLGDVSLSKEEPDHVLRALALRDEHPLELAGFVVLRQLGVALSGYQDVPASDLAVAVFARGRWDGQLAKMKPFKFPG